MFRLIAKKWYKYRQKAQNKIFNSHWYIRFGWIDQPFSNINQLTGFYEIHSSDQFTFADSFYAKHNDRHYIFFEEVDSQHPVGFLSVLEVFTDGTYSQPKPILKLDYHLSYPCIFQIADDWYMIPETASQKTIELWKCKKFPLQWEKHSILMQDIEAVDSTPLLHNGIWYLFTSTRRYCKKFGDRLDVFWTKDILDPKWQEHPMNPVSSGKLNCRMAGKIFQFQNKLIRPSQDSLRRYGAHIELKEITKLSPTEYQEKLCQSVFPTWNKSDDGCHTIDVHPNFIVMDAIRLTKK